MMNLKEWFKRITIKHVIFATMCILLALVVILTSMAISKVSNIFKAFSGNNTEPSTSETTTAPSESTQPSETTLPTETTVPPTTVPPETTYPTEPGHEHEFRLKETVAATCTTYGYKIYSCSCGKQDIPLEDQVEPYGHNYGAGEIVTATCTEDGCTRYVCSNCGDVDERDKVTAIGHDHQFVETVTATCVSDGYSLYRCTHCAEEEQRDVVAALEHDYVLIEEHQGNCTEDTYTLYQCTRCQEQAMDNVIPSPGHAFSEWIQISEILWTRTCSSCGLTESTADLGITNAQVSGGYVHDENGNRYKMYLIYVGTADSPNLVHYTINDYLNNGSISYRYDASQGLIIYYRTNAGEMTTIILPILQSAVAEIPADNAPPQPTDPSTPTETTEPSVPAESTDPTE